MIPRWLFPSFWRAMSRQVESLANPADRSWDEAVVVCPRCEAARLKWVAVVWQHRRGGQPQIVAEDLLAALCPVCADHVEPAVRRAVAEAVRS